MSWKLEGGKDLDKHVGHQIQVTGKTDWSGSSSSPSSTPATTTGAATGTTATGGREMNGPRLDVTSVKMISASCQ